MKRETVEATEHDERTKWGRVKFGQGSLPALPMGIALGAPIAIIAALVLAWAGQVGPSPVLGVIVFALSLSVPCTALMYVFVVDRSTMSGAPERPDESVERRWGERAAAGTAFDLLVVTGLALGLVSVLDLKVDGVVALLGVLLVGFASLGLRYLVISRRG